jgi:hypothetical protein
MTAYLNVIAFVSQPRRTSCECETGGLRTGDAFAFAANLCPLAPIGFISELLQRHFLSDGRNAARLPSNRFPGQVASRDGKLQESEAFERRSASASELNDRQLGSGNRMLLCPGGESCCFGSSSLSLFLLYLFKKEGEQKSKNLISGRVVEVAVGVREKARHHTSFPWRSEAYQKMT